MNREQFQMTRRSLVDRLANWDDQKNWQEFYAIYGKLIFAVARKSGLTVSEAEEAVQETVITIAKKIDGLRYDPAVGSFKGWVLTITRWRINDQFRKRKPEQKTARRRDETRRGTATIERVPDAAGFDLESSWDAEWQQNLLHAALTHAKAKTEPKQWQIFDCYVVKNWPAPKVARELGVSLAQVYLAKHRIAALVKKEVARLEKAAI